MRRRAALKLWVWAAVALGLGFGCGLGLLPAGGAGVGPAEAAQATESPARRAPRASASAATEAAQAPLSPAEQVPGLTTSTAPRAARPHPRTRVVLLGTGTPNADPDRSGPCVALVVDNTPYLVDAGPGLVRRAAAAARAGVAGLAVEKLARVFITHLHSDHTLGLPDLLFTPWVLERATPLAVYGPPGIAAMLQHIEAAWAEDVDIRLHGGEPSNPTGWRAEAHEIEPGVVYRDSLVTVTAFPVRHGSWAHAYGYRFDTPDCSVVLSGDTAPCDSVVTACDGCDILLHEAYSTAGFTGRPPEWQAYHARFHTSAEDVGRLAARARAGRVILYHQLRWGHTDAELIKDVRRGGYEGLVSSGQDLEVY